MQSMADISTALSDSKARTDFRVALEKQAIERHVDAIVASVPDEHLDGAIKEAEEYLDHVSQVEEAEKRAADYVIGAHIIAETLKEAGFSPESLQEINNKLDRVVGFLKSAGADL